MLNKYLRFFLYAGVIIMACALTLSCSTPITDYADNKPTLVLEHFLDGHISGTGIIENWKGKMTQQFDFEGDATWENGVCTFQEKMTYYNGHEDKRTWIITKINDHYYEGRTPEVVGVAKIFVRGNAMNWQYKMDVNVNESTYRLTFDDWMYLMNNDTLINQNVFKKFGLRVGGLTLVMKKTEAKNGQT